MTAKPRIGFVLEQALGHVTHAANLRTVIDHDDRIAPRWCSVPYEVDGLAARIPLYGTNWTVRAGLRARRLIADAARRDGLDALFVHTQVPAVLVTKWLARMPSVVSIDATPQQYDALGTHYNHETGNARIERVKFRANQRAFERSRAMVAWSEWAKGSLVTDYGVPAPKVSVIPPGIWRERWERPDDRQRDDGVVRILFVGADLDRKGGTSLLDAFARMRAERIDRAGPTVELHVVTKASVASAPGVHVHNGFTPNSPDLIDLYHRCDVFCLPTRADMLPLALCEAGAAGLPLVSTDVGGIREIVRDGTTGLLVPQDDTTALAEALGRLVDDRDLRRRLGEGAAEHTRSSFDAETNARRLVDLLLAVSAI